MTNRAGLYSDAKLLSRYAAAHGLLDDDKVLDQVAEIGGRFNQDSLTDADEQSLNKIINFLVTLIRPTTLSDLKEEDSAVTGKLGVLLRAKYSLRRLWRNNATVPASIFSLCLMFIVIIIPLTTLFNQLSAAIFELRSTEQQDFYSIIHDARGLKKKLLDAKVPSINN
jgi:hypothetical protein